ncbi:MAG: hypothetical protein ABR905_11125 [Terracidiphilus sp.]|jgi:hypothetical protein
MKTVYLLSAAAVISFFSASAGGLLTYKFLCHKTIEKLRVQHLEIEDSKGRVLAGLGDEEDGSARLRFLSPHQEPLLLIGTQVEDFGSKAGARQLPFIQLNAQDGGRAVTMSTTEGDNGIIAFDSQNRVSTLLLGYYDIGGDVRPLKADQFAWGLRVIREHGETGVGIVEKQGFPAVYISPAPRQDVIRRQK